MLIVLVRLVETSNSSSAARIAKVYPTVVGVTAFANVFFFAQSIAHSTVKVLCMAELAGSIHEQVATMSHEEIVRRFKKLFGREMTEAERNSFFLPNQEAPLPAAKE